MPRRRKQSEKLSGKGEIGRIEFPCWVGRLPAQTRHAAVCACSPGLCMCRNKELAAVKIQREDIDLVALEFEVDRKLAERRLREHGGDVKRALVSFL